MKIPNGMSEAEVLAAIEQATGSLARTFKFGPHEADDIKQQGALEALQALEDGAYDPGPLGPDGKPTRKLVSFLYAHIRNRLHNLHRKECRRNDPPCQECHQAMPGYTSHEGGRYCRKYEAWLKLNNTKANLLTPLELTHEHERHAARDSDVECEVQRTELLERIDRELPVELRSTYLQMQQGVKVSKAMRARVEAAVLDIVRGDLE